MPLQGLQLEETEGAAAAAVASCKVTTHSRQLCGQLRSTVDGQLGLSTNWPCENICYAYENSWPHAT